MRDKILHKASELFLTLGVKSVTMDDLAERMAISKKTIYEFYANKYDLIKATTEFIFEKVICEIDGICNKDKQNPIQNLFEINQYIHQKLKEDNNTEFQLQKYYPDIYETLYEKKFNVVIEGITENLEKGIAMGLYRKDINIHVISRFYFNGTNTLKNPHIFPNEDYKVSELIHEYLVYFIRAIATPKGLKELEKYIKKNNSVLVIKSTH
jgi:AcrR family transcriptional regulator